MHAQPICTDPSSKLGRIPPMCKEKRHMGFLSLWKIDEPKVVHFIYKKCCKLIFYSKKVESRILFVTCRLSIQIYGSREARYMEMT